MWVNSSTRTSYIDYEVMDAVSEEVVDARLHARGGSHGRVLGVVRPSVLLQVRLSSGVSRAVRT